MPIRYFSISSGSSPGLIFSTGAKDSPKPKISSASAKPLSIKKYSICALHPA